jgi:type II secretory pathway pseudopilin PulG
MFFHSRKKGSQKGITSIEIVIGVSIAALVLIFTTNTIVLFVNANRTVSEKTKALYLIEDGLELVRYLRDGSWSTLSSLSANTTYYVSVAPTSIGITTVPQVVDGYTRSFRISNVYRNSTTDDIVASTTGGSVADTSSKYITMTTAWGTPTSTLSVTSILTEIDP